MARIGLAELLRHLRVGEAAERRSGVLMPLPWMFGALMLEVRAARCSNALLIWAAVPVAWMSRRSARAFVLMPKPLK